MASPAKSKQDPNAGPEQTRPGQQLLPGYVVKLLKSLKISHGTDRTMNGVDVDPTIGIISHIIDCLGALRDINKVYRAKGSLSSRSVGARSMFGFTAELGNLLLDAITFNPPIELTEAAEYYTEVAQKILGVFPEIAAQVTKTSGKMLLHHTSLKSSPCMAINSIKMVVKAHPAAASCQDSSGALPIHWITHNLSCNFELVNYLISAYPKGAMISDMDGYLPLHWAVNQDTPNIDVVAALLTAAPEAAGKPCNKGSLPLHWAVNRDKPCLPVIQALLQAHPDAVRTFCDEGWLPIHRLVDRSNIDIDSFYLLNDLYPQGLQCPNADGQLPLHRCLDHHLPSLEIVTAILESYPGSSQVSDDEGYLPLHLALDCASPSVPVVNTLIKSYPEAAHRKSRDGLLPLHCIISSMNPVLEIIHKLLELMPDSPEHIAVDIVPSDENANPETWEGEWVKKKWTPMSRALDRRLDPIVSLFKSAILRAKENGLISDSPSKNGVTAGINTQTTRRLKDQEMPPINSAVRHTGGVAPEDDGSYDGTQKNTKYLPPLAIQSTDKGRENKEYRDRESREHRHRDRDRDRDRDREHRHRDRDRDRDRHRDRDRDRDREHRHRDRDRDKEHRHRSHKDDRRSSKDIRDMEEGNVSRRDSNDKSWIEASPINSNRDPLVSPKQRVYSGNKGSKDRVLSGDRRSDQRVSSGNRPGTRRGPGDDELPSINQLAIDIHEDETDRYRFDQQGLTVEEMV